MSDSQDAFEADGPGLDLDAPPQPTPHDPEQPYRVLARKYRPQSFGALIGQDAMVQTLANSFRRDRIAHAFLLTGVRGVGKTSTARLIAKALNCIGPDGDSGPTIDPCGVCEPCRAIAEGRHIDVIEMDAASHTGIADVREITEAVRYAAVSARYKVYIIDEVHMLSQQAFNGLLKTLEEPPPHVKFLFATTEVTKVPVTVLSRCQRFDLRRIPADTLAAHFRWVCGEEGISAEEEALQLIARAAEGSARDGLSILDQAIAHGAGGLSAGKVREMLGLSDRGAVRALFGKLLSGDAPGALVALGEQYDLGVDPASLLRGLLEAAHGITRAKVGGAIDPALSTEEREAFADWASRLGQGTLHRIWQMLLKGLDEVERAPVPQEAAEMALLRIVYAAGLPDPGELAAKLASGEMVAGEASRQAASVNAPGDFASLVQLVHDGGEHELAHKLHDFVGLVRYDPPHLIVRPNRPQPNEFVREIAAALGKLTGKRWSVETSDAEAEPSLYEQQKTTAQAERDAVLASPVVAAARAAFPEAELIDYDLTDQRSA